MSNINKSIINKILNNINIVDEVSKDVQLEKRGKNFIGLCPFHDDTNPSFSVSPEKKICHCFVCHNGGNVINYRKSYNKISYNQAVILLAKQIGININQNDNLKRLPLHYLNEDVCNFYHDTLLKSPYNSNIKHYLNKRNISEQIIQRHLLGFCDVKLNCYQYILDDIKKNNIYNKTDLDQSGLFTNNGYDFFAHRLIIPLQDENGLIIGFSGRIIDNSNKNKYLNSKDTPVFNKGKVLYNFHNAKEYLENKSLIIVEGFFDVFGFEKQNIYNVVASMGTSFTNDHIQLLKKYRIENIYLALDMDLAGQKASYELGNKLLLANFNVKIITFKGAKDIDEYVNQGHDIKKCISEALDFCQYKMQQLPLDLNSESSVKNYVNEIMSYLSPQSSTYQFFKKRLMQKLMLDENEINNYINVKKTTNNYTDNKQYTNKINSQPSIKKVPSLENTSSQQQFNIINDEMVLIRLALTNKQEFLKLEDKLRNIKDQALLKIVQGIKQMYNDTLHDTIDYISLCETIAQDQNEYQFYFKIIDKIINIDITNINEINTKSKENNKTLAKLLKGRK